MESAPDHENSWCVELDGSIAADAGAGAQLHRARTANAFRDERRTLRQRALRTRGALNRRVIMLISAPIIILGSHLFIMVADKVPRFDITRGCRLDSAASSSLTEEQPLNKCINDEQGALQRLQEQWSEFATSDRASCTTETTSDDTPSYVELLTCLQEAREARGQPPKNRRYGADRSCFPRGRRPMDQRLTETHRALQASRNSLPDGQIDALPVQPLLQKYSCFHPTQIISLSRAVSCPLGGACRDRHGRWARDAMDADALLTNSA
jgi:hypothetical protein